MNNNFNLKSFLAEGTLLKEANALDSSAPDWQDYEGYELILQDYFDTYNLEDPQAFKDEVYEGGNWDSVNNFSFDIAKRAGYKGDYNEFIDDNSTSNGFTPFYSYCTALAHYFLLKFGGDMGIVDDENDQEYQKELQEADQYVDKTQAIFEKDGNI